MIDQDRLDEKIQELLKTLYEKRLATLEKLTLTSLVNKNPYLYRSIGLDAPSVFVKKLLDARISSSDETIFGNELFEPLALWAAQETSSGFGRTVTIGAGAGQDIAIEDATSYIALSVKSGKKIFNSQSIKGQNTEFVALQTRVRKSGKNFRAIVGYGYGRKNTKAASTIEKIAGQSFWKLITNEDEFYVRIQQSIGKFSENHYKTYSQITLKKTASLLEQFTHNFVDGNGINWEKLISFNSSTSNPKRLLSTKKKVKEKKRSTAKQSSSTAHAQLTFSTPLIEILTA